MPKDRFKITPASYLVLIQNDKILMLRRFNTGYRDGSYSFVAGHLDGNETFKEAMAREAKEEADITIDVSDLEVVHVMHRKEMYFDVGYRERIDAFLVPRKWGGEPKNMEPNKCDDMGWFPINELPENTIPFIKYALKCIKNNVFYSEFGFNE